MVTVESTELQSTQRAAERRPAHPTDGRGIRGCQRAPESQGPGLALHRSMVALNGSISTRFYSPPLGICKMICGKFVGSIWMPEVRLLFLCGSTAWFLAAELKRICLKRCGGKDIWRSEVMTRWPWLNALSRPKPEEEM